MMNCLKRLAITMLLAACMLLLIGCSTEPTYFSKKDILNYVKNVYGKEYKLIKEEERSYTFQDERGFSFTAATYSHNITFDASETMFYEKKFYTDYIERLVEYHSDDISYLADKYDLDPDDSNKSYLKINISDAAQLEPLSRFITELDKILAIKFDNDKIPENMSAFMAGTLTICVYMGECSIYDVRLSNSEDNRLEPEQVYTALEGAYVNCVKMGDIDDILDKELMLKYPSYIISPVYYLGEPLTIEFDNYARDYEDTYNLYYDSEMEAYLMLYLDPCQDFADFPYSYFGTGTFKNLVELLGGTYTCDNWEAVWNIGDSEWKAVLHTKKANGNNYSYDSLEVRRNGVLLELSEGSSIEGNGTVSGRKYTTKDLEQMLDITFEIDQINSAAHIIRND